MKILVALDATAQCQEIVSEIASRSWLPNTTFILLHVVEPFSFRKMPRSLDRARDAAEAQLNESARRLGVAGLVTEERVALGRPHQQIVSLAESLKVDLIVMGSRGAGGMAGLLLGSTARAVLSHAPCSVEIVRPDHKNRVCSGAMNILVAVDGSECSKVALHSIVSRIWPAKSTFRVVSIPHPSMPISSFPTSELKDVVAIKHAKHWVESGAKVLRSAGLNAEAEVLLPYHSDGREIVNEAVRWPAHVIVLGSHGRHGFDRFKRGSVSEYVSMNAACTVVVLRNCEMPKEKAKTLSKGAAV